MKWFLLAYCIINSEYSVCGRSCLEAKVTNSEPSNPPYIDGNYEPLPANNAVQAIITTYKFYCDCVNITSWETFVEPGNLFQSGISYNITFHVWRPFSSVNETGCYRLVGQNVFENVPLIAGSNVILSPPAHSVITAQSGDVVGYYTNSSNSNNEGIQLLRESSYNQNIIWYNVIVNNDGPIPLSINSECQLQVGFSGSGNYFFVSSTNAAPMLKISATAFSCVMSTSGLAPSATITRNVIAPTSLPTISVKVSPSQPSSSAGSVATITISIAVSCGIVLIILAIFILCVSALMIKLKTKSSPEKFKLNKFESSLNEAYGVVSTHSNNTAATLNNGRNVNVNENEVYERILLDETDANVIVNEVDAVCEQNENGSYMDVGMEATGVNDSVQQPVPKDYDDDDDYI